MKTSENISKLAAALNQAQADLKNPLMDSKNPHFKSKFASLLAVRDAVQPILKDYGISVVQLLGGDSTGLTCETVLIHTSGEWLSGTFYTPVSKQDPQGYGSAATYARRYSLLAITNTVGDPDDDGNEASRTDQNVKSTAQPTAGAFESLDTDMQTWVQDMATEVGSMCVKGDIEGAVERLSIVEMDNETKTALWSLLDSKHRSAIKKFNDERKKSGV